MSPAFAAPTGTRDILPPESARFAQLVATFSEAAARSGYGLALSPLFEDVGVFQRGMGEGTEIARKEMYVFEDRGGRPLALRPEGTASIVRAFIQHRPTTPFKVWYVTPAFRYERPQAGRFRQHHQVGVEALGPEDPLLDVEVIALAWRFYEALGLRRIELLLNSMGDPVCRAAYLPLLDVYLAAHEAELCDEHQKEWRQNPLRVFDCKRPACRAVTDSAPKLLDHLCEGCAEHFAAVQGGLAAVGIPATVTPRLVRGFDYYTRTTFEFAALALDAAQNAIGGGGRYDGLTEALGGPRTPGVGFGSGIERILLALDSEGVPPELGPGLDCFVIDTTSTTAGLVIMDTLGRAGLRCDRGYDGRSMKAQMKVADRSGARLALLIGPQEASEGTVTIRDLRRADAPDRQRRVALADLVAEVRATLWEGPPS